MAPGVQEVRRSMCLGLSAATGVLLAISSGIAQKQDASAVEHLQLALTGVFGLPTYPAIVALALISLALALSFIFSADSNKRHSMWSPSILGIMMTAVPYKAAPELELDSDGEKCRRFVACAIRL